MSGPAQRRHRALVSWPIVFRLAQFCCASVCLGRKCLHAGRSKSLMQGLLEPGCPPGHTDWPCCSGVDEGFEVALKPVTERTIIGFYILCVCVCTRCACLCAFVCVYMCGSHRYLGWCFSVAILFIHLFDSSSCICTNAFTSVCAPHVCSSLWGPEKDIRSPRTALIFGMASLSPAP